MAAGDLTVVVVGEGGVGTEWGQLNQALKALGERLFQVVTDVRAGTTTLANTSSFITRGTTPRCPRAPPNSRSRFARRPTPWRS
jgi:methyl-accepting chemotaxis protein